MLVIIPDGEPARWRGRPVPPAAWFMPAWTWRGVWFLLAAGYTLSGLIKLGSPSWVDGTALTHLLQNPLARPGPIRDFMLGLPPGVHAVMTWGALAGEILFLPLCLWRGGRRLAWTVMVGMHLGILSVVAFADLTLGMLMVHLFTFDAAWIRPVAASPRPGQEPLLLYDGTCGLCHAVVCFILREDPRGVLRFAPLQSEAGQAQLRRLGLPGSDFDSLIFLADRNDPVGAQRTAGVIEVARRLGGIWRLFAELARLVPAPVRDLGYRAVARTRYALFGEYEPTPWPDPAWGGRILD